MKIPNGIKKIVLLSVSNIHLFVRTDKDRFLGLYIDAASLKFVNGYYTYSLRQLKRNVYDTPVFMTKEGS